MQTNVNVNVDGEWLCRVPDVVVVRQWSSNAVAVAAGRVAEHRRAAFLLWMDKGEKKLCERDIRVVIVYIE